MVWQARGKSQASLDLFELHQTDAWERFSRLIAMVFNTTRTKATDCKQPFEFNALAKTKLADIGEQPASEYEPYPWAEPESEASNGDAEKH